MSEQVSRRPAAPADEEIAELLRGLPRERAGGHFTARVLARLDAEKEEAAAPWLARLIFPVAAAVVLIAGLVAGIRPTPERPAGVSEARRLLEEIRREHGRLEGELEALRAMREEPVVYLGGDEEMDLVLDLGEIPRGEVRPAAARP